MLKRLLKPADFPDGFEAWEKLPFAEKTKKICHVWAIQGFGEPNFVIGFYVLKLAFYVFIWFYFCSFSRDLGTYADVATWWFKLEALAKAIFWTVLIEVVGFGGSSGPLSARYLPPLGGITYFLRPRTIKMPLFPKAPIIGGDTRNILDVILYAALLFFLIKICIATSVTPENVLPVVMLLPILGVLDRTIFLAARGDVYFPAMVCFLFPLDTGNALKIVWFAVWFWAALSKLTPSFTSVVCVMICNSPVLKIDALKKRLFKNYPDDLRPSLFADCIAHCGTLFEFLLPITLLLTHNQDFIFYILIGITCFHAFIFINLPMAVPLEWNIIMVFGGWLLFYRHPEFSPASVSNPFILLLFFISYVLLPIVGNLFPKFVSFLMSMRYYAGTWAYSIWLFKGDALDKIDAHITKSSPSLTKQLNFFYDRATSESILSRVIAFRLMHLPGRALHDLIPKAVDNIDAYTWTDGEFVAGEILGWNFGDGHLHHEPLLNSVQKRCHYAGGDLRVIMVESPQFHTQKINWRIYDAKDGLITSGFTTVGELKNKMPWIC